jgi:hypothetical protein
MVFFNSLIIYLIYILFFVDAAAFIGKLIFLLP